MRKTRIMATLLCVIMLVCALPVMQASAAVSGIKDPALMSAIAKVMDYKIAVPATNATWATLNMDFANDYEPATADVTKEEGITYGANGITFPAGESALKWKYANSANISSYNTWSPQCGATNYSFRFKLEPGGSLRQISPVAYKDHGIDIRITEDGVVFYSGNGTVPDHTNFKPGTEWNDVLVYTKNNGVIASGICSAYEVWMKKESDAQFTRLGAVNATTYTYAGASCATTGIVKTDGLTFQGNGAYVKHAISAMNYSGTVYDSIEAAVGAPVSLTHNFNLDQNTSLYMYNKQAGTTGIYMMDGGAAVGQYTENGYQGKSWRFSPYADWCSLGGEVVAVSFTAKTSDGFNVQGSFTNGTSKGRWYFNIVPNTVSYADVGSSRLDTFLPDTGWADYLVTKYNGVNGYVLYMKSATLTNDMWVPLTYVGSAGTNYWGWRGIIFDDLDNNKGTFLKNVKIYSSNLTEDADTIPDGENKLYYEEEFAAAPTYPNYGATGSASYKNNELVLWEGPSSSADATVTNAGIPVGGYADLRVKSGAAPYTLTFADGSTSLGVTYSLLDAINVIGAETATATVGEDNNSYRNWRVVHNSNGTYSVYTKSDDELVWYPVKTNIAGKADDATPQIKLEASANYLTLQGYGTSGGIATVDYIKIYGPVNEAPLTLTDGYGTKMLENNDTLTYSNAIRPIVNVENGKLLFVTYKGNDLLKAQILNAEDVTDKLLVNGAETDATKIKVFLWDNFTSLNRLTDSFAFNF